MKKAVCLVLVLAVVVAGPPSAAAAVTCDDVRENVGACSRYATGRDSAPSAACCDGVRALHAQATTTEARRAVCNCLKQELQQDKAIKDELVVTIPDKCSVPLSYRFSSKTDCSTVP